MAPAVSRLKAHASQDRGILGGPAVVTCDGARPNPNHFPFAARLHHSVSCNARCSLDLRLHFRGVGIRVGRSLSQEPMSRVVTYALSSQKACHQCPRQADVETVALFQPIHCTHSLLLYESVLAPHAKSRNKHNHNHYSYQKERTTQRNHHGT